MKYMKLILVSLLVIFASLFTTNMAYAAEGCDEYKTATSYIDRGYCVPGLISNDTWFNPTPQFVSGKATWYAPYKMNATAEWRGMSLEGFKGGIAMMSPADIGEVVWLHRPGNAWEGPYLVVDVSARVHMYTTVVQIGEVIEVDFDTAMRWGMISGSETGWNIHDYMIRDVEVWKGLSPPTSDKEPIVYKDWYVNNVVILNSYTPNRRWSADDSQFTNYDEYENAKLLVNSTSSSDSDGRVVVEDVSGKFALKRIFLTSLDKEIVVWFKRTGGNWRGPFMVNALMASRTATVKVETETEEITEVPKSNITISDAHHYTTEYLDTIKEVDEVTWEINCDDGNVYTGFMFKDLCVPGVISKESWLMPYPKHTVGVATYYYEGVMDRVLENRDMSLDGYVDGIVLMTCGNIGDSVWVRRPGLNWEGPYLVVDCGGAHGVWAFTEYRLHVEVDVNRWNLWRETTGTQSIEICIGDNSCDGNPIYWGNYWLPKMKWIIPLNISLVEY